MSVDPLDLDGLLQDAKKTTGSPRAPPDAAGLESFSIRVPSSDEQKRTTERLEEASIPVVFENGRVRARDPWNIGIEILAS